MKSRLMLIGDVKNGIVFSFGGKPVFLKDIPHPPLPKDAK